jgi:hypothetical protein
MDGRLQRILGSVHLRLQATQVGQVLLIQGDVSLELENIIDRVWVV